MEMRNWTPTPPSGELDAGDWRSQLPPESRNKIVNKVMETLKRHFQFPGDWDSNELEKFAKTFEEKMYNAASNQDEYMRKISMKLLTLEKTQNPMPDASANPPDPGTRNMPQQVHSHGQSLPVQLQGNQTQARQQLLSQNIQNNINTPGVQSSSVLSSTLTSVSGLNQNPIPGGGCLNTNMLNMSAISQNLAGGLISQGIPDNMFANQQRQMQGRLQVLAQQQQQSQNLIYQQQQLQQLSEQNLQQGNLQHSLMQSQIQQQQHNLLQPTRLQVGQQSGMQSSSLVQQSSMQSSHPGITQNQQSSGQLSTHSMLQKRQQSALRQKAQPGQTAAVHQQQAPMTQQQQPQTSQQLLHQQPQLMCQQANASGLQQNQLSGHQNNLGDIQQHQQQRLLGHQNNLPNLQQHPQHSGSHSSFSGLQQHQQQQLRTKTDQNSLHMIQSKMPFLQRQRAASSNPTQGPPSQAHQTQQQFLSQMQSQPNKLQQQVGLQQQSNISVRDMLQRRQTSGQSSSSLLQSQNLIDQQKHLYQPQRAVPETSSTSLDSTAQTANANPGDWQEEIYQKIRAMKEVYLPELSEQYHKITQHENIHEAVNSEQFEKMKNYKTSLQRMITYLNISKNEITHASKDKLVQHENNIMSFINAHRPRKLPMQQGQVPQSHMHVMLQTQSQNNQARSHDDKMNPQLQSMKLQGAMSTMPQGNMANLQQNSMSCFSGSSNTKQGALVQLQPGCDLDSGRGNAAGAVPQVLPGSLQNPVTAPQHVNINALSSQGGANSLQSNMSSKPISSMLQNQHLKQQQDHMLQSQHLKQQRQHQHQYLQKQQLFQQQQAKQQLHAQLQTHQMPQLLQMNEANEMNMRQGISVRPVVYQHIPLTHRPGYTHPQLNPGAQFPISLPQLFQVASPLPHQHSSQQVDQQSLLSSITKAGTPLQPGNSAFAVPSPSTPITPSLPGDTEKHITGTSSLSHFGNSGHQQTTGTPGSQSLAIGTPGISASPLLAEFTAADGPATNTLASGSGRSNVTEEPLERLIKAVMSLSSNVLSASVSDIGSVVSMIDAMAGSAPGNGSRAAVGEDLVTTPKCCLQARNFIMHDKETCTRKRRRYTNALPQSVASNSGMGDDMLKKLTVAEVSDLESTATSHVRRPKLEASHALLEEIKEINQQLIDTVVDISNEDFDQNVIAAAGEGREGTVVKCSYIAVALCPNLKSKYAPVTMPLLLLVPSSYPTCSPVLLDKFPLQVSRDCEDLSVKAKSKFSLSLRCLSQPLSLEEMARTWDVCARAVILEYSEETGGGSFSTKYGTWEDCMTAP